MRNSVEFLRASIHLYRVDELSDYNRKRLADWLRDAAEGLQLHGRSYAKRYRARYLEKAPKTARARTTPH